MKIQKRLERLKQEYFPESKRRGFYLWELKFMVAFSRKYVDHEDSARDGRSVRNRSDAGDEDLAPLTIEFDSKPHIVIGQV